MSTGAPDGAKMGARYTFVVGVPVGVSEPVPSVELVPPMT
jgi:hypothetical protein